MRKIILALVVFIGLAYAEEEIILTQEQTKELDTKCKDGNIRECAFLGESYFLPYNGISSRDFKKAAFYYKKVCKKDNEKDKYFFKACSALGIIYAFGGDGVKQNYEKALGFSNLACDAGDADACRTIGLTYYSGVGVPQDLAKGAEYFQKACVAGSWMACSNFAQHHYNHGDKGKATSYFKKACELGKDDPSAQIVPEFEEAWQYACDRYEN
ncbi:MAG: tetratricopeptide repeat protein [Wolinella sp.]